MRYADTLLAEGELIAMRTRQHPLALLLRARWALVAWGIAVLDVIVIVWLNPSGTLLTLLGWIALIAIVVGLVLFFLHAWGWTAQDYLVTNRRILMVEGIFNKHAADSSLEKINDAVLDQNMLGRMLDYGDLDILTAAEVAVDKYRMLAHAPAFKREMANKKHELEEDLSGRMPSPPLTVPPSGAAAVPEMADRLAELKGLRDQGLITPEEYEAKRTELLGRI
ncbi:MAG: PH domain-containing protein [Candidatus Limnocylindrales bacterium]